MALVSKKITFIFLLAFCFAAQAGAQLRFELPSPMPLWPERDSVRIFIIGDVMMHRKQLDYDYTTFLEDIRARMDEADVCIANMEFSLGGPPYTGYPSFSAPDGYAGYLADCGTDIFLLGNNHIYDRGYEGLKRTVGVYKKLGEERGTLYTGVGGHPLIFRCKGMSFAIVNFTYEINGVQGPGEALRVNMMDRKEVGKAFEEARTREVDFIIAMPHWGEEYMLRHSREQEDWARWMISQGAGVVVGGHPHVVQDTAHIDGVPVIYSMGNAVSNMSARNTRLEAAVTLTFVREGDTLEMLEPEIDYMWCTLPGMLSDTYRTIMIKEWTDRRGDWSTPSDFDNMMETLERVVPTYCY